MIRSISSLTLIALLTIAAQTVLAFAPASASAQAIVTKADLKRWNTEANVQNLARLITSEASVGNTTERTVVAYTVLNRMKRNAKDTVTGVWSAYAHNQAPTKAIIDFARKVLAGQVTDISQGATHYYSPRSMPMEGAKRVGDTAGGLERVLPLLKRNYRPGWAVSPNFTYIEVLGTRSHYFKFYRAKGNGRVV